MQLRTMLSLALALCAATSASAQDQLFKRNGQKEDVKIKEVGTQNIVYKRYDNQSGPDYVIPKNQVTRIQYENGSEDIISSRGAMGRERERSAGEAETNRDYDYGKNIIAFSPIAMTNTSSTGVGLSYERVLDKNYIASFYLPITVSFRSDNNFDNSPYYNSDRGSATVFWAYPGVKLYPTGSNRRVSYAIGASLPLAFGTESELFSRYLPNGNYVTEYRDNNIFLMGAMLTNYLNIQPSKKLFLGLQFGLGIPYIRSANYSSTYRYYGENNDAPWVDFSFRIGYRF